MPVTASALEDVSLKAAMVLLIMLLQKTSRTSKQKEHISRLQRSLKSWQDEDLDELIVRG